MAKGRVSKLSVVLEGTDKSLSSTMKKGAKEVNTFANSAEKDLKRVSQGGRGAKDGGFGSPPEAAGFWGEFAKRTRKLQQESRKSGEARLGSVLGSGRGITDATLQALGLGVQGVVIEAAGRSFAKAAGTMQSSSGEASPKEFVNELAEGLPIIGEWVSGWTKIISLLDGSAKEAGDLNRQLMGLAEVQKGIAAYGGGRSALLSAQSAGGFSSTALHIDQERLKTGAELGKQRSELEEKESEAQDRAASTWGQVFKGGFRRLLTNEWHPAKEGFNESDAAVQEAMRPFEQAKGLMSAGEKKATEAAQLELHKLNEESLDQMDRSIAGSRLSRAVALGGNPAAVLAARQNIARLTAQQSLYPINRELTANKAAIAAGRGLNGLTPEELEARNVKLEADRKGIVAASEAEITRMTIDEGRTRAAALLEIEHSLANDKIAIDLANAVTGEQRIAAAKETIDEATAERIAEINRRMNDPSIGADERRGLARELVSTAAKGEAEKNKVERDEARRRAASLLEMEHGLARGRISIMRSNAHDTAALWAEREASIKEDSQEALDAIDQKLKDINITEAERNKLLQQRRQIQEAGAATLTRAKIDFDREVRRDQQSTAQGLIGVAGHLLGNRQAMPFGNNPAAMRMQRQLGVMSDVLGTRQQIESILNNPNATPAQKDAARAASAQLSAYQQTALSSKNLNRTPYVPLQFAEGEQATGSYEGRAEYQREQDASEYAKSNNMIEEQQATNALLKTIVDMMARGGADNPLFPK